MGVGVVGELMTLGDQRLGGLWMGFDLGARASRKGARRKARWSSRPCRWQIRPGHSRRLRSSM
ncbi:hypothetical protein AB0L44_37530 [Nonomuraea wenchangensis]|uniref:hypothetical protein n=1 Tax=Nonomuraea wenchangensis TaxID=568860 RepID=UPI00342A9A68